MFKNITEVKRANKAAGHYWFSVKDSRRVSPLIGGRYWVESNRPFRDNEPRKIQAAGAADNGEVTWLKGGDTFESVDAAKAYIRDVIAGRTSSE